MKLHRYRVLFWVLLLFLFLTVSCGPTVHEVPEGSSLATVGTGTSVTVSDGENSANSPLSEDEPSSGNPERTTGPETGTSPSPETAARPTDTVPLTKSPETSPFTNPAPGTTSPDVTTAPFAVTTGEETVHTVSPEETGQTPAETTRSPEETTRLPEETTVPTESSETTSVPGTQQILPESSSPAEETTSPAPDYTNPLSYADEYAFLQLSAYENAEAMQAFYQNLKTGADAFHSSDTDATSGLTHSKRSLHTMLRELGTENAEDFFNAFEVELTDINNEEAYIVWYSFKLDHPLYYWMASSTFTYGEPGGKKYFVVLCEREYHTAAARMEFNTVIYDTCREICTPIIGSSAYWKALHVHDTICKSIDYKYDAYGRADTSSEAHSIVGYFSGFNGVCECYAKTFQLLMNLCDVDCITAFNLDHAWNLICLEDGQWYWVDVTFDDAAAPMHVYFCKNDTEDIWVNSGYLRPGSARDATFLGIDNHNILPAGGPDTPYQGKTYRQWAIYFVYALPARAPEQYIPS